MYVANLVSSIQNEDLKGLFAPFGEVVSAEIISDRVTGFSRGYGFVEMKTDAEGRQAIEELNKTRVNGRNIFVVHARCESSRTYVAPVHRQNVLK